MTSPRDITECRQLIRNGSRSFHAASLLLPQAVRDPAYALYAFCRLSDDAVDGADARPDAIARLRDRLDRIYAGKPADLAADRAFADVVSRFAIPKALPEALIEGLEWDAEGRRFRTLADLEDYAARVAGTVGAMMTLIMGVRDPVVLARATDLGVAMQLTNIARDIGEDARAGRLYLPTDWCTLVGLDPERFLAAPHFDTRVGKLAFRLLDRADQLYRRAGTGIAGLPFGCRPAIHAARLIYRAIGREIAAKRYDSVSSRARTSGWTKLVLAAKASAAALATTPPDRAPALAANRFLIDAISLARLSQSPPLRPLSVDDRIGWVIDLFDRMDKRRHEEYAQKDKAEQRERATAR